MTRRNEDEPLSLYAVVQGCGVRLRAPAGDTDCTDWFVLVDEEHARTYITELWDVDPDAGEENYDFDELRAQHETVDDSEDA